MDRLGFSEGGASLEDKKLSKGIERAQRKVEERNFSTRKHLLEWDEPMDYQRKEFYAERQRILEERDLPELIFSTIENAIQAATDQFLGGNYDRSSMAEWCRVKLDVLIEEDAIDTSDLENAEVSIRRKATDEAHDAIRTSLGEYIDREEEPKKWDLGGLLQWARRTYNVSMTQNQLRKMDPEEIEDELLRTAQDHYATVDLSGLAIFLDPDFPYASMAEWARTKFAINIDVEDIKGKSKDEAIELLGEKVREAYHEREINYPVEAAVQRAFGPDLGDAHAGADFLARWSNRRYGLNLTADEVLQRTPGDLRQELLAHNRELQDGKLAEQFEEGLRDKDDEAAIEWAKERIGGLWNEDTYAGFRGSTHDAILAQGREMLRRELTLLEQYMLLRIYDQAWKDHLLEMDHLKSAIMQRPLGGDQTHPQSQFAIEGRKLFGQMWERIAGRVTDIIFKVEAPDQGESQTVRTTGGTPAAPMTLSHADSTGAGFAGMTADQRAAMKAQGVEGKVETIRREQPRVKRNDPCPCGSGKKYKQCHGKA
ncbi:MAG: SEC-C metal-binding domain-containing protein [Planctomycetota bacterium]